jgi:hypothetical protein
MLGLQPCRAASQAPFASNPYDETRDVDPQAVGRRLACLRTGFGIKQGPAKVPDWFLWSLVVIGLILAVLVILILRFLRDVDHHDRDN